MDEPVLRSGVLVIKIASFEGSGYLGRIEDVLPIENGDIPLLSYLS